MGIRRWSGWLVVVVALGVGVAPLALCAPVRVEAEAFTAFNDFYGPDPAGPEIGAGGSGGQHVGYTAAGEWLEYNNVSVPDAGYYQVTGATATDGYPGSRTVELDGTDYGDITVPNTGG